MKVLHLLKTSAGATWALRQMRELVGLGVEVHVVLPAGGPLVPRYQEAGVMVHLDQTCLPVRAPWRWPDLFERFRRLVTSIEPDLIHSHFVGTTLTMRFALGKDHHIPRIFQVPGPLHLEHALHRRVELQTAGKADYWVGSCRWTCDRYLTSGVDPNRIFLAYYGVDLDHFVPSVPGKLRRELGLTPETKVAGMISYMYGPKYYLGQTRGLKGHEDFIDALTLCTEVHPDLVGVVVGGAWGGAHGYERRVRAHGKRRLGDRIHFLGTRPDIPDLYADLDVVAHPSLSENVGGAAESMILGVPTIATNLGGFPDLVEPNHTGWLVPPRDPAALATAILDALDNPAHARDMAINGRMRARSLLDVKQNARDIVGIYGQISMGDSRFHRGQARPKPVGTAELTSRGSELAKKNRHSFYPAAKRTMDIVGSAIALIAFAPLMALVALILRFALGRAVIFAQLRPGLGGKPFRLYKFRTMRESFDASGAPLPDAARLTAIGRFFRRTSLDELPQLWNVLKGDLSLVGPRPLLMEYLPLYTAEQSRRHEVKPGMTGWAQVNGRNALAWEEKFRLDVWYVDHRSLRLDLTILAMTLRKVVSGVGVASDAQTATAHLFRGTTTGEIA